jgi:hypothetical protein
MSGTDAFLIGHSLISLNSDECRSITSGPGCHFRFWLFLRYYAFFVRSTARLVPRRFLDLDNNFLKKLGIFKVVTHYKIS